MIKLPGSIRQSAFQVADLEPAVEQWCSLGVGPWYVMREVRQQGYFHRGDHVEPVLTLAFANSGELQIELIVAHDDAPSAFTRASAGSGHHHHAWWAEDWDGWETTAASHGWAPISHGDGGGFARWAYYDTGAPHLVEVMELNGATNWLTQTVRDAHATWDGETDPVRVLMGP